MWRLISANEEYHYLLGVLSWSTILALAISNSIFGAMEEVMAVILFLAAMIFGGGESAESAKTKRIRMLSTLPVSVRKLGLFHQCGLLIGWTLWMTLLAFSSLISQRGSLSPDYGWWILTRIGCMFLFAGFWDLANNLFFCVREKKPDKTVMAWVVSPLLGMAAIAGAILYFVTNSPGDNPFGFLNSIADLSFTLPGSLGILLFSLIIVALNVFAYERRRSFLEESVFPS